VRGAQLADDHGHQAEDAQRGPEADLVAAEPVLTLAGIQHHLQHPKTER